MIQKCQPTEKYAHLCTQYLVRALFAQITDIIAAWLGGDQPVALLRCYESSIAAFRLA